MSSHSPQTTAGLPLDHIGFVMPDLETGVAVFAALSGFRATPVVEDPHHGASIRFLEPPEAGGVRLEILVPMGDDSRILGALKRGGGIHHLCFGIASLDPIAGWCAARGVHLVSGPLPAPAMGTGRRVAFIVSPGLGLVELAETAGAPGLESLPEIPLRQLRGTMLKWLT